MIDTVVLESPEITENTALIIENSSLIRYGLDMEVDKLIYKFTSKVLKGSFDSSIRINVNREKWVSKFDLCSRQNIAVKEKCNPFLRIELSLHKFFLGHNIYGGSNDLEKQVSKLIYFIEKTLDVTLPSSNDFVLRRLDYAKCYNLGDNIKNFFQGFSNVYYPRRKVQKYDSTGLYFPGTYTTLKLYDKGVEFKKHDRKNLIHFMDPSVLNELTEKAYGVLRIELEIKARKLKNIYGDLPKIRDFNINDIIEQYNIELKRIFKVCDDNMKLISNYELVEKRLIREYGQREGNILIGTWHRLSISGYENVMRTIPKSTFYRHVKKIRDAGISWNHTNIGVKDNNVVEFVFNPFDTNLEITDDLIKEKIAV